MALYRTVFLLLLSLFLPCYTMAQTAIGAEEGKIVEKTSSPSIQHFQRADDTDKSEEPKSYNPFTQGEFPYEHPSFVTQALALSFLSLSPFIIMLLTSFAKISIVLSLLRNALGTQQAPPNQVINGVALLITIFIMFPTALKMYDAARPVIESRVPQELVSSEAAGFVVEVLNAAKEPFRDFLKRNTAPTHRASFYKMAYRAVPEQYRSTISLDNFIVLVPAFITTQLKGAFEVGILIYLPFFVIDLVTSNILLAMGMMMLSPVTISLPLKIFLLVMMDAWTLLIEGLVMTYK